MKGFIKSFGHAAAGIRYASTGRNFRIQSACGVTAIVLGALLGISQSEWVAILLSIGIVLSAEAMSTAVEEICDKFHPETHPHIAIIKDVAAGAVLFASLAALAVGIVVFGSRLLG